MVRVETSDSISIARAAADRRPHAALKVLSIAPRVAAIGREPVLVDDSLLHADVGNLEGHRPATTYNLILELLVIPATRQIPPAPIRLVNRPAFVLIIPLFAVTARHALEEVAVAARKAALADVTRLAHVAQVELDEAAVGRVDVELEIGDASRSVCGDEGERGWCSVSSRRRVVLAARQVSTDTDACAEVAPERLVHLPLPAWGEAGEDVYAAALWKNE